MAKQGANSSKSPRFFRVILAQILECETLELPRNFVEEHGKRLSNYATLKVPTGEESKMELKRCNGRAWLHNGWQDFVVKYSIKCGHFLVFRYKGGSRFNVLIFDYSTSEIAYHVSPAYTCNGKSRKRKLIPVKEEHSPQKLQRDRGMENANLNRKLGSGLHYSSIRNKSIGGDQVIESRGHGDTSARQRALERAKAFHSPNPHFILMIQPSSKYFMGIPAGPGRSYFCERGNNSLSLKGENGRVWSMRYKFGAPPRRRVRFCSGWTNFLEENRLQEGDVCAFELVNSTAMAFKVTIFRISDDGEDVDNNDLLVMTNVASSAMERVLQSAENFKCKNPHFIIRMTSYYLSPNPKVHIPVAHSRRYLKKVQHGENVIILHGSNGRNWPVYLNSDPTRILFMKGWKDFASENRLRVGDVLVFEMIIGMILKAYKVTIFRVADHNPCIV